MKKEEMTIQALYDLTNTISRKWLEKYTYPWEVLPHIGEIIEEIAKILPAGEYNFRYGPDFQNSYILYGSNILYKTDNYVLSGLLCKRQYWRSLRTRRYPHRNGSFPPCSNP